MPKISNTGGLATSLEEYKTKSLMSKDRLPEDDITARESIKNTTESKFLQGLLKLPLHEIKGRKYILAEDIGKLSDRTFGKTPKPDKSIEDKEKAEYFKNTHNKLLLTIKPRWRDKMKGKSSSGKGRS